jgi:hypothetical protein
MYTDNWVDVDERAKQHPDTFEKPDNIDEIVPGCYVKICNNRERFFVMVTKVFPDGTIHGKVSNHLVFVTDYQYGDMVEFLKKHVFQVANSSKILHMLIRSVLQPKLS